MFQSQPRNAENGARYIFCTLARQSSIVSMRLFRGNTSNDRELEWISLTGPALEISLTRSANSANCQYWRNSLCAHRARSIASLAIFCSASWKRGYVSWFTPAGSSGRLHLSYVFCARP